MTITIQAAATLLLEHDRIAVLAHRKPDGDTIGCAFALLFALEALGKTARVECADGFPPHYNLIYGDYRPKEFTPALVVAADTASMSLLGGLDGKYPRVHLCVDHHKSNELFADHTLLDPDAPAAAQVVYKLILELGLVPDRRIASALYLGLTTDTGCFRFANVTAETHRIAAGLIDCGAEHYLINKRMFDMRTRGRLEVEKLMLESLTYHFGGRCAFVFLPADIMERFGVTEEDLDGISAMPRRIEGVLAGVTLRQNPDGSYRVSLRTENPVDASRVCMQFGGGGHQAAAGCTMLGTPESIRERLLEAIAREPGMEAWS